MQYKSGTIGRVFLVRFDHGDDILGKVKELAKKENISLASIMFLGALEKADIVAGPKTLELPPEPMKLSFSDGREVLGFGTIASKGNEANSHIHIAIGKGEKTLAGCLRDNSATFLTIEAVITEIEGITVERKKDDTTGINLRSFS